ncbi:MAG: DUF1707 domain-containing protein [Thermoleophilaceae bacterium]
MADQKLDRLTSDPDLRASQADREQVVDRLRFHAGEGRLELEELEQRIGAALAARTHGDLAGLLGDLPRREQRGSAGRGRRVHLQVFVMVQLLLVCIWALTGMGYFWPVWPLLGWGIGLAADWSPMCRSTRAPSPG